MKLQRNPILDALQKFYPEIKKHVTHEYIKEVSLRTIYNEKGDQFFLIRTIIKGMIISAYKPHR